MNIRLITIIFNQKFTNNNLELEVNVSPEECDKNSVWAKNARAGSDGKIYYVDYYKLHTSWMKKLIRPLKRDSLSNYFKSIFTNVK